MTWEKRGNVLFTSTGGKDTHWGVKHGNAGVAQETECLLQLQLASGADSAFFMPLTHAGHIL